MFASDTIPISIADVIEMQDQGSKGHPFQTSVTLHRMVAKVLLTCDTRDDQETYADIYFANVTSQTSGMLAGEDISNYQGWCRIEAVRYKLQCTNRATYFIQKRDRKGRIVDPNYPVAELIQWTGTEATYRDTLLTTGLYSRGEEFVFLGATEIYDFSDSPKTYQTVTPYERGKKSEAYTGGFYCLENTCDNQWIAFMSSGDLNYALAFWRMAPAKVVTSLVVQARYTPAVIYTKSSILEGIRDNQAPGYRMIATEAAALDTLKSESDDQLATFYCINGRYCYTYLGMKESIAYAVQQEKSNQGTEDEYIAANEDNYQVFTNGYCYYQEYFSDLPLAHLSEATFTGVERNKYYLLHCTEITAPTTSETSVVVMTVYSDWQDWKAVNTDSVPNNYIQPAGDDTEATTLKNNNSTPTTSKTTPS
jgi:hypothetical protein